MIIIYIFCIIYRTVLKHDFFLEIPLYLLIFDGKVIGTNIEVMNFKINVGLCICCVGIVTCLYLSNISVDWSAVAVLDRKSYRHDPVPGCFHDLVIYMCTSYNQLVECHNGRIMTAVGLPFNDGDSVKELESVTGSALFIVHSRSNMVALVDMKKNQVHAVYKNNKP